MIGCRIYHDGLKTGSFKIPVLRPSKEMKTVTDLLNMTLGKENYFMVFDTWSHLTGRADTTLDMNVFKAVEDLNLFRLTLPKNFKISVFE